MRRANFAASKQHPIVTQRGRREHRINYLNYHAITDTVCLAVSSVVAGGRSGSNYLHWADGKLSELLSDGKC